MPKLRPAGAGLLVVIATATSAQSETALDRGRYLMQSIVACGNCHTPLGPNGPVPGQELAGRLVTDEKAFTAYAPNITPDRETGIGGWTDAQIVTAVREGRRPDGSLIGPPMPIALYRGISDGDMAAIVAYLRSVKPVRNVVPKSQYRVPLPPSYGPPVGKVPDVARGDKLAYGRYLAGPLGHCVECHSTPGPQGAPDLVNQLGAGGMKFTGPWGESVAANITPRGLARYSDGELKKIITSGVRPDGSKLLPPMGTAYYARMSASDLDALVAYLRSLPPK
jgi:mono/diheme cytochrome c family protein